MVYINKSYRLWVNNWLGYGFENKYVYLFSDYKHYIYIYIFNLYYKVNNIYLN